MWRECVSMWKIYTVFTLTLSGKRYYVQIKTPRQQCKSCPVPKCKSSQQVFPSLHIQINSVNLLHVICLAPTLQRGELFAQSCVSQLLISVAFNPHPNKLGIGGVFKEKFTTHKHCSQTTETIPCHTVTSWHGYLVELMLITKAADTHFQTFWRMYVSLYIVLTLRRSSV